MPPLLFIPLALGAIATVLSACSNSNKQSEKIDGIDIIATPSKKLESKDTNPPSDSYKPSATVPTTKPTPGLLASASPTPASTTSASTTSNPSPTIAAKPSESPQLIVPNTVEYQDFTAKDIETLKNNKKAFEGKKIINTNFNNADLSDFSFRGSTLDANRKNANNNNRGTVSFYYCNIDNTDFTNATLHSFKTNEMDLNGVKFINAQGSRSNIVIAGSHKKYANVNNTEFRGAKFKEVLFEYVNFQNTNFQDCNFDRVLFRGVTLDKSNNLNGANFSGAVFMGNFSGADFSRTTLDGALIDSDRNTQYSTFKSINLSNTRYKFVRVDEALGNFLDSNSSSNRVRAKLREYKGYIEKGDMTCKSIFIAVPKTDKGNAVPKN
jgi:uncharacterized protein YjbI with pentapeptide repeats